MESLYSTPVYVHALEASLRVHRRFLMGQKLKRKNLVLNIDIYCIRQICVKSFQIILI
uniref:Uncharacterized protein n=1 Tax=uncultured bacterium contig00019 TaxID=1181510 RepID=A0A806K0P3_9BACT|nr:hypothetical protein [uncultured bacterium contig00019]